MDEAWRMDEFVVDPSRLALSGRSLDKTSITPLVMQ
jgi:hypothetical protein